MSKLPDFSGVWERGGGGGGGGAPRGAAAPAAGTPGGAAGPRGNAGAAPAAGAPARGAAGRGGGARGGGGMSLTPEYEAKRREYQANPPQDTAASNCLPPGMPGIMTQPYPMEFLLTPGKVTIVIEAYTQVRHIYMDGRKLPEDPDPRFFGTSVGRWEGDTLVVDTVGFSPRHAACCGRATQRQDEDSRTLPAYRSGYHEHRDHDYGPRGANRSLHNHKFITTSSQLDDLRIYL